MGQVWEPKLNGNTNESKTMKKEYVIWGTPPGTDYDQPLLTVDRTGQAIHSRKTAEELAAWLREAKKQPCRIQELDFETPPDFAAAILK